jgi:protein O-GlcNAc transferase
VRLHTRLTPINMALDIDHASLWKRAARVTVNGRTMTALAPEDDLLVLALLGSTELWCRPRRACDIAYFIQSHQNLDWAVLLERATTQGCRRMVVLAAALAGRYFGAALPDAVATAEAGDTVLNAMAERIEARWLSEEPADASSTTSFSLARQWLHDGTMPRVRCIGRSLLLPRPLHVSRVPLPARLTVLPAYIPIKIVHDIVLLPLVSGWRALRAQAERSRDALASHDFSLPILPFSAEARRRIRQHHRARTEAQRTLEVNPYDAGAWRNLGTALLGLRRYKEAIACYDKALAIAPDSSAVWQDRGVAIRAGNEAGLSDLDETPTLDPGDADSWVRHAAFFSASQRFGEAVEASDRALVINPMHLVAMRIGIRSRISACDWHRRADDKRQISECLEAGLLIITPFNHRTVSDSEAEHLAVARLLANDLQQPKALWHGESYRHNRIRVAYLSADFLDYATAVLMVGVFEHHDRKCFETTAISLGPDDGSEVRRRVEAAMERFIDVRAMNDAEIATMLHELEIDIAIDLDGNRGAKRQGILARRPAPVQVNYLGNPGTMGLAFYDYIIADRVLIPAEHQIHYSEQVVYLPHTYMPNDRKRAIAENTPTRAEAGLPETGFVFACHNAEHKIGPEIFDVWMRLLQKIDGSVLWLKFPTPSAMGNLRREARARGVDPDRLVFAHRMARPEDHLARLRLANLFLDTLPYNAHATACDALWAGLPVVTCLGNTFAGRVAASLLGAVGLPELIASSLTEYEELALSLARDPQRLAAIRVKLEANRQTEPLFDTARFTGDLEAAYAAMWERAQRGRPAESFSVRGAPRLIDHGIEIPTPVGQNP